MNYDEKAFADKEPRNIVDVLAKTDASVMNFGGESATLQGVYVRGLQLGARQFSVNGLAGLYSAYNTPTTAVGSAQLIKGASTATVGMAPLKVLLVHQSTSKRSVQRTKILTKSVLLGLVTIAYKSRSI